LKVGRNARISQKWFHCYGQPAQMEDEKCFERGLIIMGDLPGRKDKMSEMTWYDSMGNEGWRVHSKGGRVRKHTTWEVSAQRRTKKEAGFGQRTT
jgi:hypothetical protein